jgi:DNA-binding CsgD family transcriptional regulator
MLSLSRGDVDRLRTALRLLVSPHDFPDVTTWRLAVCDHLLGWIHTDAVYLTVSKCVSAPMVGLGRWGRITVSEYVTRWHNRQEVDQERYRRNLRVWVRDQVISRSEFRRTRYYGEFCAHHGNLDSAGAWHRFPDGEDVVLHFNAGRPDTFPLDGRSHGVIALLHPALVAGATAVRVLRKGDCSGLIDASGQAIGLVSLGGRVLHATPRLAALMSGAATGSALRTAMKQLAAETGRLLSNRSFDQSLIPSVEIMAGGMRLVATASIVRERVLSKAPVCLVTVHVGEDSHSSSMANRFSLTARERQIADLLARGRRNREIALALGISEHTARRPTERVLTKLGVRSRSAVAGVLNQGSAAPSRGRGDTSPD